MSVDKLMLKLEEEYKSTQYLVEEKLPKELAAKKKSCNNIQVHTCSSFVAHFILFFAVGTALPLSRLHSLDV